MRPGRSVRAGSCRVSLWEDSSVRTHGWPYPFQAVAWEDISASLTEMAADNSGFQRMADIAGSVIASESGGLLAGCTSHHDLIVVSTPFRTRPAT